MGATGVILTALGLVLFFTSLNEESYCLDKLSRVLEDKYHQQDPIYTNKLLGDVVIASYLIATSAVLGLIGVALMYSVR